MKKKTIQSSVDVLISLTPVFILLLFFLTYWPSTSRNNFLILIRFYFTTFPDYWNGGLSFHFCFFLFFWVSFFRHNVVICTYIVVNFFFWLIFYKIIKLSNKFRYCDENIFWQNYKFYFTYFHPNFSVFRFPN